MHSPHITQFSPLGARLRAAEREQAKQTARQIGRFVLLVFVGALLVAPFCGCVNIRIPTTRKISPADMAEIKSKSNEAEEAARSVVFPPLTRQ